MKTSKERLLELLRERSFRPGTVTLASGKTSDFFIDCKRTVLCGDGLVLVGEALLEHLESTVEGELDALAAVPLGGCPLVDAVALIASQRGQRLGVLYVRPQRKDHGTTQLVEGLQSLGQGARVALIEDVVTSGGSSLRAVESLREAGLEPLFVLALIDRLEGGREHLAQAGVELRALFTRHDFIP